MAIAFKRRMCSSLRDALETEPVLMTEALPDAMLAAFLVLFVAALFVAAYGISLACLLRPDPLDVRAARLPSSRLDLLCSQLTMIVGVFVGASLLATLPDVTLVVFLMIGLFRSSVKAPGLKNEATLLEHFPLVKKSDGIDLKMLAGLLSVEQDLLLDRLCV